MTQNEYGERWPFGVAQGRLRCEGRGAIILTAQGDDYAVNGMAANRYASIPAIWKKGNDPNIDIGPIISRGLTCVSGRSCNATRESLEGLRANW
jgi:Protein of unknown function (DUF2511)